MIERKFTARVHEEDDGSLWAEIEELPGVFSSGDNEDELRENIVDAIILYLSVEERPVRAESVRIEEGSRFVPGARVAMCV